MNVLSTQQKEAIAHLNEWKVGALFMEAGTGKTRVAVELVNSVPCIDRIIWVGPLQTIRPTNSLLPSVRDEVSKWGGFRAECDYFGIESISSSDRIYLSILSLINSSKHVFMVVDESLKMKNANAKRTQRLLKMSEKVEYKLILNGTPLSRNILDMWSQMEFLSHKILNMSLRQFKNTFCRYTTITKRFGSWERSKEYITGFANLDYLHSLIRNYVYQCDLSLRVTQNYHEWRYVISDELIEKYNDIKDFYLNDERLQFFNDNIFFSMTQQLQHSYCLTEDKFNVVDDILSCSNPEKTIIYCKYIVSQEECKKRYPKCLILSYQKESLGLNLQDYNNTIYFDKIWDYALRIQSGRRTYRTGQNMDCQYYDLTGNVGLEHLIDKNIEKKISMTEYFKRVNIAQIKKEL